MLLSAAKSLIALLAASALLTACGGGHGSSAPPPVGGLTLDAGEGGVTLTWTAVTGVDYWAYTGQSTTICKNCGNNANNWNSLPGAQSRGWSTPMSSPYFFTGNTIQSNLNNNVVYSFIMDGRINGGPGGEATPAVSAAPRLNGERWFSNGDPLGKGGVNGLAFGPKFNSTTNTFDLTGTYLGLGTGGLKYQSANGLTWTPITSDPDTTNWKSATYAFPGTIIQKFIGVGAGGSVVYSNDLVTFKSSTSGSQDLNAVATSFNTVVAVGNNGTILRTGDGLTWYAAASVPSTANLYAVTYAALPSGGLWIAVGAGGVMFVSTDASTWSSVSSGTTQDLKGISALVNTSYPQGIYSPLVAPLYSYSVVAVGNAGAVTQTSDGVTWTAQSLGKANLNAIVASTLQVPTNQFMVVGDSGKAYTSPDGLSWTARTTTSTENLVGLIRGYNNQYLAWAANGTTTYSK